MMMRVVNGRKMRVASLKTRKKRIRDICAFMLPESKKKAGFAEENMWYPEEARFA